MVFAKAFVPGINWGFNGYRFIDDQIFILYVYWPLHWFGSLYTQLMVTDLDFSWSVDRTHSVDFTVQREI